MPRTDEQWLDDLRAGGERAASAHTELSRLLRGGLAKALSGRRVDAADIEDFAQDAIMRVIDRLDTYRGESRFTTWAVTVAVRVAFTHMRRRQWGETTFSQLVRDDGLERFEPADVYGKPGGAGGVRGGGGMGASRDTALPGAVLEEREAREKVLDVMRSTIEHELTPRQRRVLLAELAGMPKEVIAQELGISSNAMYKSVHDARKSLKRALEAHGVSAQDVRDAFPDASSE